MDVTATSIRALGLRGLGNRVVITGGSGFVGRRLRRALPDARILDRRIHQLDAPGSMVDLVRDAEVIVHLAGENAGSGYSPPLHRLLRNNVLSTAGLIEALERYAPAPLVVLVSTIHVYGQRDSYAEGAPTTPTSFYGFTKLAQEVLLCESAERGRLRALVLRASNIYGPGCRPYYNSAVATFCDRMRNGETIELMGSGRSQADLIYVDDVVRVIERAFDVATSAYDVYNASSGSSVPIADVVEMLGRAAGVEPRVTIRDGPPQVFKVPNQRLRVALGNFAFTPLEQGLRETWVESASSEAVTLTREAQITRPKTRRSDGSSYSTTSYAQAR